VITVATSKKGGEEVAKPLECGDLKATTTETVVDLINNMVPDNIFFAFTGTVRARAGRPVYICLQYTTCVTNKFIFNGQWMTHAEYVADRTANNLSMLRVLCCALCVVCVCRRTVCAGGHILSNTITQVEQGHAGVRQLLILRRG
jgi:hypothetical protein